MRIQYNNIIKAAAAVIAVAGSTACSDTWDDHYAAADNTANGTVWEAMQADNSLTNFTRVVKACNYDLVLSGSQTLSVFAPTDNALGQAEADELIRQYETEKQSGVKDDDNKVLKQFIKNHISLYTHPVSTLSDDSITMMNGKYTVLTSSTIGGKALNQTNQLKSNGMLFTVEGQIPYYPNVYEYTGQDSELDSVYNFLSKYNEYVFDASQSVPGEIKDGKTHYLDSVTVLNNPLFNKVGFINREDSAYWMLAPTNSEWDRLTKEYDNYFIYDKSVSNRDSMQYTNSRMALVGGGIFNANENNGILGADTLYSTLALPRSLKSYTDIIDYNYYTYANPFAAGGIFEGTEDIELSNGHVRKAQDYRISKYQTFVQSNFVSAVMTQYQDTILNAEDPLTQRTVVSTNPFYNKIYSNVFAEIVPENSGVNPQVTFRLPNLLSNMGYDIYAVFVPAIAYDTYATDEQRLPCRFISYLTYNDLNGKPVTSRLTGTFETKPDVVDSVLLASNYKFPTCTYNTDQYVKIRIQSAVGNSQTSKYSRTMRIAGFYIRPHREEGAQAMNRK